MATTTIIRNARVVTPLITGDAGAPLRGGAMGTLSVLANADVTLRDGVISAIKERTAESKRRPPVPAGTQIVEANGRVLMPGFVDCHTHACWAGSRYDEWDLKRKGVAYLDILKRGGGIMATVRSVREASQQQLTDLLLARLNVMLRCGTTTVEIKSGYGLSTEHELKMLRAISAAAKLWPGTVRTTALLGHAIDEAQPGFVGITVRQTLPAVAAEFPVSSGLAVDAFCEQGTWSLEQCILLLGHAHEMGYPIRVHADQFNSLGMVQAAIRLRAQSVDHLEVTGSADLSLLAQSQTQGVFLPLSPFHLGTPQAKPRPLISAGGAACIATNYNPGSGPSCSMPMAISLAVRQLNLSHAEAITASTHNPAMLLKLADRGSVAVGKRADVILLRHTDERGLAFEMGEPGVDAVWVGGERCV